MSDENLSALLIYFSLGCLAKNIELSGLTRFTKLVSTELHHLSIDNLLEASLYLLDLLQEFLPTSVKNAFPIPTIVSLQDAALFYRSEDSKTTESLFSDIANLGFAYQIFNLGTRKNDALPALQTANKKISTDQLINFTQLYTPNWVVDFLLANTVLTSVTEKTEHIPPRYKKWTLNNTPSLTPSLKLKNCQLLDPACGAGQFLFSAYNLFSTLYEQNGCTKNEAANMALGNIYGADIDKKALWVAGLGLLCQSIIKTRCLPKTQANLIWSGKNEQADFLGSIDKSWNKEHTLNKSYEFIVTNPPYLGRKCISRDLKTALRQQYPNSSADLCAAFLERCTEMLKPDGYLGVITQSSLLSLPSYSKLRSYLSNQCHLETIVHCGPGVFPLNSGEKIDSVLLIARANHHNKRHEETKTKIFNLTSYKDKSHRLEFLINNRTSSKTDFQRVSITGPDYSGFEQQIVQKLAHLPKLGEIADIRQGLATTNNDRFVRYHFDVEPQLIGTLWIPYVKGAGGEKFSSDNRYVVKWGNNGEEIKQAVAKAYPYLKGKTAWVVKNEDFYFRPGLCFSFINKSGLAVRRLPAGCIFDVASSAIFPHGENEDFLLAYLNSSLLSLLAKSINRTINIQVGDLKKLPIFPFDKKLKEKLSVLGHECLVAKEELLRLEHIDLTELQNVHVEISTTNPEPRLLYAEQLDTFFAQRTAKYKALSEKIENWQQEIDNVIFQGVKQLNILSNEDVNYLLELLQARKIREPNQLYSTPALLAAKFISSLIANLLCSSNGTDRILSIPKETHRSLAQSLGLSNCGKQWLDKRLDRSLEQIFFPPLTNRQKTKVIDISKLANEPSRYFSLWLNEQNACYLFSARALKQLGKASSSQPLWKPVLNDLQSIKDWTSKDLINTINALTANSNKYTH